MPIIPNNIVGMMWNKNEGDILEEIILEFLPNINSLFIADDGSNDNSWNIIQSLSLRYKDKIEHIQQNPNPKDLAQRNSLLNEVRKRYKPENTWVQILDSDMMILDTNIKKALPLHNRDDVLMNWNLLNAARKVGTWKEADTYPNWSKSIKEIMPYGHYIEKNTLTFRPLEKLEYDKDIWRPWPKGFAYYVKPSSEESHTEESFSKTYPLIAHYGYRGPVHFYTKFLKRFKSGERKLSKYPTWNFTSSDSVENTVHYFNGTWNTNLFLMNRESWIREKEREINDLRKK